MGKRTVLIPRTGHFKEGEFSSFQNPDLSSLPLSRKPLTLEDFRKLDKLQQSPSAADNFLPHDITKHS